MESLKLFSIMLIMIPEAAIANPETTSSFHLNFPINSTNSYVKPLVTFWTPLDAWTICFRVRPSTLSNHTHNSIFSYAIEDRHNEILISIGPNGQPQVFIKHVELELNPGESTFYGGVWDHVCVRWALRNTFSLKSRNGIDLQAPSPNTPIQPGGVIILGQDQDVPGGGFEPHQVFNGDLADLHVWDYVLPYEAVHRFFCCDPDVEGNLISWNKLPMRLIEVETHYTPKDSRLSCLGNTGWSKQC